MDVINNATLISSLQLPLHIIPDKEIIPRHLAADDVKALVVGTTDDVPFEFVMLRQVEVVDFYTDIIAFMRCKIIIMRQECEAICT